MSVCVRALLRLRRRDDHGAQAVEFAIVAPVLLALVYGLIAFGFVMNYQITASQLAREAARSAAICTTSPGATAPSCDDVGTTRFNSARPGSFSGASISVDTSACFAGTPADATATVSVSPLLTVPFLSTIKGKSTTPCGG